ncbi:hypothetical protein NEFER01_1787 [Nematocida sp. LUAm1]|nr:hypothetical protein NEFER02_1366 [Nematocida sp. LUAm2]KAI5178668.1 hypothetical protein NEFER01_1787 [Nematocida sp. LUAm1]
MRGIRHRNMFVTTLLILSFFMLFHTTLDTAKKTKRQIDAKKLLAKRKKDDKNNTSDVNNTPMAHENTIHLQPNPIDITYTYNENIMINEKDVLYMAVYMNMVHIEFLGEEEKIYSLESEADLQEFHTQIEQKKVIWIHVVQNTFKFSDCLGTSADIQKLINRIMRKRRKHIVIDPIANTQYNLHIDSVQEKYRHLKRLRKLDLVWWHILAEHAYDYSLTFYTPLSTYTIAVFFVTGRSTFVSITFDAFMQESVNFRKSYIIFGIKDGYGGEKGISSINHLELFSMLSYRVNQFLLDKIKNGKYPFLKIDRITKEECEQITKNNQPYKNPAISQSVDISSTTKEIDSGIKPIYFILTGFHIRTVKYINFEALLAISHPQIAKIYFNILNQMIGYNKYWITRYSPLYVDFSYCVLNTLHEECFNEFFSKTEYLLIRDIDRESLDFLLTCRFYAKFPYFNEVPMDEYGLLKVSSNLLKVHIKNEELKEFFPKMAMKNMIYCYTKHMLFMKSTLRVKENHKHPKHKIFDVLIFKKPLKEYITIKTEKETKLENETKEEKLRGVEELSKITEVINRLDKSRCNRSQNIITLDYSIITKNQLKEIVNEKVTSQNTSLHESNRKEIRRMNAAGLSSQKEISQIDASSSSVANKEELKRKNNSSSNSQANIVSKRPNTSSNGRVDHKQTSTANSDYSCTGFVEDASNTSTDTFCTIPKLPLFASSFSTNNSHPYGTSIYSPYYNNNAIQPESSLYEQQNYRQQANMQTQDSLAYVASQDEDPEYPQSWINRFIDSELGPTSNIPNYSVNSADFSAEDPMETDTTLDAYEHNMLNTTWAANV